MDAIESVDAAFKRSTSTFIHEMFACDAHIREMIVTVKELWTVKIPTNFFARAFLLVWSQKVKQLKDVSHTITINN